MSLPPCPGDLERRILAKHETSSVHAEKELEVNVHLLISLGMSQVKLSAGKVNVSGKAKDDNFYISSLNIHQEGNTDLH